MSLEALITERFELEIPVIVRTRPGARARSSKRNPLADVATDPKRYQVSFLAEPLDPARVEQLNAVAAERRAAGGGRPRALRLAPGRRRPLQAVGQARRDRPQGQGHGPQLDHGGDAPRHDATNERAAPTRSSTSSPTRRLRATRWRSSPTARPRRTSSCSARRVSSTCRRRCSSSRPRRRRRRGADLHPRAPSFRSPGTRCWERRSCSPPTIGVR